MAYEDNLSRIWRSQSNKQIREMPNREISKPEQ